MEEPVNPMPVNDTTYRTRAGKRKYENRTKEERQIQQRKHQGRPFYEVIAECHRREKEMGKA